jgi:hypothetical protein
VIGPTGSEMVSFAYRRISDLLFGAQERLAILTLKTGHIGANLQQCCLAHTWRPNNGNESRGWFLWDSVDERDMETLFLDLLDRQVSTRG